MDAKSNIEGYLMTEDHNKQKEQKEQQEVANNTPLMSPPKHIKDKTIFYKYSGYLRDLLGEEKQNGSMG